MSTHPNTILLLALTPDSLARKTMANILSEAGIDSDKDITIGGNSYHHLVMESDYDDGYQIHSKEGDLVFFDFVTYGYGEAILWHDLEIQKRSLEEWAQGICAKHSCSYQIRVTSNYW